MTKDLRSLYTLRLKCIFQLGFYCLLRRSEFIPTASSRKECLRWNQVTFSDEKKKVIPFWDVARGQREPHFIQVMIIWSKYDVRGASKLRRTNPRARWDNRFSMRRTDVSKVCKISVPNGDATKSHSGGIQSRVRP